MTVASETSTLVPAVTKAAVASSVVPLIATAFVTVTVPAVLPPRALRLDAVAVASASLTVTVITSVDAVLSAPRSARKLQQELQ